MPTARQRHSGTLLKRKPKPKRKLGAHGELDARLIVARDIDLLVRHVLLL
jgi:hypothetical protein